MGMNCCSFLNCFCPIVDFDEMIDAIIDDDIEIVLQCINECEKNKSTLLKDYGLVFVTSAISANKIYIAKLLLASDDVEVPYIGGICWYKCINTQNSELIGMIEMKRLFIKKNKELRKVALESFLK